MVAAPLPMGNWATAGASRPWTAASTLKGPTYAHGTLTDTSSPQAWDLCSCQGCRP